MFQLNIASLLLLLHVGLFADTVVGNSQSEKEKDIINLLDASGVLNIEIMREAYEDSIQQSSARLPEAFAKKLGKEYRNEFRRDQVIDNLVLIYDRYFTHEDIRGLIEFFHSPLGRRLVLLQPKVTTEQLALIQQESREAAQRVVEKLNSYIQAVELQYVKGQLGDAIDSYRQSVSRFPDDPDFRVALGKALRDAGRENEA